MRQALYRRYRPKNFDEVVGQDPIITVLKHEMKTGNPAHAYLFIGSRGTGKTSCAKLVAKAVNCPNLADGNPCGVCEICRGVEDGSLLDVVEIDAASNSRVDDIRQILEEVVFTPAVAKYRVYIIDEVHMLSASAFNALLKTLEEPPPHVIFVLATTEVHKVLPTIISRCQRFDFRRIETSIIAARLQEIAGLEQFTLTPDAAYRIARLSDGGMRDALSLLDVCAANTDEVTAETVANAAGQVATEELGEIAKAIAAEDTPALFALLASLTQKSMEPQRLCEQLVQYYRNLMLVKTVQKDSTVEDWLDYLPSEIPALREQAAALTLGDILHSIEVLQNAIARMSRSTMKRAELEMALVSLSEPSVRTGNAALLTRLERLEGMVRRGTMPQEELTQKAIESPPPLAPPPAAVPCNETKQAASVSEAVSTVPPMDLQVQPKPIAPPATPISPKPTPPSTGTAGEPIPFRRWGQVLEQLGRMNSAQVGMLMGTKAYEDGRRILIDVSNPVVLEMLKSDEYIKKNIKQAIYEVTGVSYGLGPYRPPVAREDEEDPLERLARLLPANDPRFTIES